MKKLFFTLLFAFGFMLLGFASQNLKDQKKLFQLNDEVMNEKTKKYDFSLFKFTTLNEEKPASTIIYGNQIKQRETVIKASYLIAASNCFNPFSHPGLSGQQ